MGCSCTIMWAKRDHPRRADVEVWTCLATVNAQQGGEGRRRADKGRQKIRVGPVVMQG